MKQRLVIEKNNRTVIYGEPYEVKKSQTVAKFHKKNGPAGERINETAY